MLGSSNTRNRIAAMAVAGILAASACLMVGCSNSDQARQQLKREAEDGYGVLRTVTAYSQTGEEIGSWYGKIDIEYGGSDSESSDKVDLVFFDGDKPIDRVVISGPAIVVADNEGETETRDEGKRDDSDGTDEPGTTKKDDSDTGDSSGGSKPDSTYPDIA